MPGLTDEPSNIHDCSDEHTCLSYPYATMGVLIGHHWFSPVL